MSQVLDPSAMAQALGIPELLNEIFKFLDKPSNARNARVCREWCDVALDFLWRDVNSIHRILNCLSPLVLKEDNSWVRIYPNRQVISLLITFYQVFSTPPTQRSWISFEKYRRRVYSLQHIGPLIKIKPMVRLSHTIFSDIAKTRPANSEIFPNLRSLMLDKDFLSCMLFAHSEITSFKLHIRHKEETESWYSEFFPDISCRMPNLTEINIEIDTITPDIVESLTIELLKALPKLRIIFLPPDFTTKIAECCSQFENLHYFSCQSKHRVSSRPVFTDPGSSQPTVRDGFPSLWRLYLSISFDDAIRFIGRLAAPWNMVEFCITSPTAETRDSFAALVATVAEAFTEVRSLSLRSPPNYMAPRHVVNDPKQRINISVLGPLLRCSKLRSLNLIHGDPFNLHYKDLEEMALAWLEIEQLNLNPIPAYYSRSSLTLEALQPFARHSHELRNLGLFMDTSHTPVDLFQDCPPFRKLEILAVNLSMINNIPLIAMVLSHVCPVACRFSPPIDVGFREKEFGSILQRRAWFWGEVETLLPYFAQTRMQERKASEGLASTKFG